MFLIRKGSQSSCHPWLKTLLVLMLKEQRISSICLGIKTLRLHLAFPTNPSVSNAQLTRTTHWALYIPHAFLGLCSCGSLCSSHLCLLNIHPPFETHPKWQLPSEIFPNLSNRNIFSSTSQFHGSTKPSSRACSFCLDISQQSVGFPAP